MKKKIFTLMTLALIATLGVRAQDTDPVLSIGASSATTSSFLKVYETEGITVSSTYSWTSGYVNIGDTPTEDADLNNLEVLSSSAEIEKISFLLGSSSANSEGYQPVVFGWSQKPAAGSNIADTYRMNDAFGVTAANYSGAVWQTYDFSDSKVKCVRIYRGTKKISSINPEYTGSSTALGAAKTIRVFGIKVWLKAPTQTSTPVITPADGAVFTDKQEVSISCATTDAKIQYSVNGGAWEDYDDTFTITSTSTIQAKATADDLDESEVATAKFTKIIVAAQPTSKWNFTNWSEASKTGILADNDNWNQYEDAAHEKTNYGENGRSNINTLTGATLKYGETNLAETDGLLFDATSYMFGLMFNVPTIDGMGKEEDGKVATYHGSQYIWLYGNAAKITIPNVTANAVIKIGVESHKLDGTDDATRTLTATNTVEGSVSTSEYTDATFTASTTGDVTIYPSKGMHVYYITVYDAVETVPVTIGGATGLQSFASTSALDLSNLPEGLTAYAASGLGESSVKLTEVTKAVAAGTGLIFEGETNATYDIPVAAEASELGKEENLLTGVTDADGYTVPSANYVYALSKNDGKLHPVASGEIVPVGRAYLTTDHFAAEAAARGITLDFGDGTTGITGVEAKKFIENNKFYNLNGQEVLNPTKGLYIVNGKKVIIK